MNGEPIRILRVIARLNIGEPAIQAVTLSDLRAPVLRSSATAEGGEARGSRWVDTETGEGYKLARHGIVKPLQDNRAFAEALLFAQRD